MEEQGKKLVIDPGGYTAEFGDLLDVVAVVVTHAHPDHFDTENLNKTFAASPQAKLFTTGETAGQLQYPNIEVVKNGSETPPAPPEA